MVSSIAADEGSSDDANTPLQSPKSQNTSREEDDSSNANESDCKSPNQRPNQNYQQKSCFYDMGIIDNDDGPGYGL
ncbi:hypothetical protein NQ317_016598 [Molorchus minor]|uniref:Uncharacterized protein n=1 Tax=Molorchus minor TaxID=1323400 RepID=A0ABQ9J3K5_9CUCU|nr:hypothetical protein NQ317_016598 [Molorchus minor]